MKWFILVFITQFQNTLVCLTIEIQFGQNNKNGTDIFSTEWTLGPCYGPKIQLDGNMDPVRWQYYEGQLNLCSFKPGE